MIRHREPYLFLKNKTKKTRTGYSISSVTTRFLPFRLAA